MAVVALMCAMMSLALVFQNWSLLNFPPYGLGSLANLLLNSSVLFIYPLTLLTILNSSSILTSAWNTSFLLTLSPKSSFWVISMFTTDSGFPHLKLTLLVNVPSGSLSITTLSSWCGSLLVSLIELGIHLIF